MISDRKIKSLNLSGYKRHIILCSGSKCCGGKEDDGIWAYLKQRLDEEKLSNTVDASVCRTRALCLRVCTDGPVAVVYPEATWYRKLDTAGIDLIIRDHLKHGKLVPQYLMVTNETIGSVGEANEK